jgi:hypothetical protein
MNKKYCNRLYDTDYLLKDINNQFVKDINGYYVIYSDGARDEEVMHDGDEWIKTTKLPKGIQERLIRQLEKEWRS